MTAHALDGDINAQTEGAESIDDIAARISERARARGVRIACAESLTSGTVASALGRAAEAAQWFRGGLVAYGEYAKVALLGVTPGPTVSERCATEMAMGVCERLAADVVVSITGVGGPGPTEGKPPGTVIIATCSARHSAVQTYHLPGDPADVVAASTRLALVMLREALDR